jgi:hypothetical protein
MVCFLLILEGMDANAVCSFRLGRIVSLALAGLLISLAASATYNKSCMELLSKTGDQAEVFAMARSGWEPLLIKNWGPGRRLSAIEFETLMDVSHGLSSTVTFDNGKKRTFIQDAISLQKLAKLMEKNEIVAVTYLPDAQKTLGVVLKKSCETLGRSGCESYEMYSGLISTEVRPFSAIQEQAIKWCTVHMAAGRNMPDAHRKWTPSPEDFKRMNDRIVEGKQASALYLLTATFEHGEAERLHREYVAPYISAASERLSFDLD